MRQVFQMIFHYVFSLHYCLYTLLYFSKLLQQFHTGNCTSYRHHAAFQPVDILLPSFKTFLFFNYSLWKVKPVWHWNTAVWVHSFHSVRQRVCVTWFMPLLEKVLSPMFIQNHLDRITYLTTQHGGCNKASSRDRGPRGWQGGTKNIPPIYPYRSLRFDPLNKSQNSWEFIFQTQAENPPCWFLMGISWAVQSNTDCCDHMH